MFAVLKSFLEGNDSMRLVCLAVFLIQFASYGEAIIMYSSDNGASWNREESGALSNLNAVSVDIATGITLAVGDEGTILRRGEDQTWVNVSPEGLSSDLYSVASGLGGAMVCGAEGTLLSSFDGGLSWRLWSGFECGRVDLFSVNFDPTHMNSFLILGEGGFVYSSEGENTLSTGLDSDCLASCVSLCCGFPELILFRDGSGFSLRRNTVFRVTDSILNGVTNLVSGSGRFIVVGDSGSIFRHSSADIWESISSTTMENLNDVSYLSWGLTVCSVGTNGTVLISYDNGLTWSDIDSGTRRDLTAITGNGAGIACIVGKTAFSDFISGDR